MKSRFNQAYNREQADHIISSVISYREAFHKVVALDEQQNKADEEMVAAARNADAICAEACADQKAKMEDQIARATMIMLTTTAIAILIGIILSLFISRGITGPVIKGVKFAKTIADGNLTAHLNMHQKDELGQLADALNIMNNNLKDMTLQIQDGATQIASSSEELSATAQQLAEGAQTQASSLEETSASIEELTSSVEQVSEHAQSQTAAVEESSTSMDQAQKSVE